MGNQVVAINQGDVSVRIRMLTDADGTPATGIDDTAAGHVISYQRGFDTALVTDGGSAADLAAITSAHSDWGFFEIGEGWYRVDYPDAAFAEGVGSTLCTMSTTAESAVSVTVIIEPLIRFQGSADSVTATTTTLPSGTTPLKGDSIMVVEGTGDVGNQVLVTSVAGEVATHAEFETGISATTTTIVLLAGNAVSADGGINCDAPTSDAATPAEVNTECDTAITDAGLSTAQKLLAYFQLALRSDAAINSDNSTEVGELNADEGSGAGTYDNVMSSAEALAAGIIFGAAQTGTLATTSMTTDLTGYLDDELNDSTVVFTGGTASGQRAKVSDYASASGLITFSAAIQTAPADGDTFKLV